MGRNYQPAFISDICLLLRTHSEHRFLNREVVPVLLELEDREHIPDGQLGAALAYLEVHWLMARRRAAQTDAARVQLRTLDRAGERALSSLALRYLAIVYALREVLDGQVAEQLALPADALPAEPHLDGQLAGAEAEYWAGAQVDPVRFSAWRPTSIFSRTPRTQTAPWRQRW